jgi:hypothetical protein
MQQICVNLKHEYLSKLYRTRCNLSINEYLPNCCASPSLIQQYYTRVNNLNPLYNVSNYIILKIFCISYMEQPLYLQVFEAIPEVSFFLLVKFPGDS